MVRGVLFLALGFAAVAVTALAMVPGSGRPVPQKAVAEVLALADMDPISYVGQGFWAEDAIRRGDTLSTLLARFGVVDAALIRYVSGTKSVRSVARGLRPGDVVRVQLGPANELLQVELPGAPDGKVMALVADPGGYKQELRDLVAAKEVRVGRAEITYSLFGATDAAGIPDAIAVQMADIFGGEVDFHREIQEGDNFTVAWEQERLSNGEIRAGRILSAQFFQNGRQLEAYYFSGTDGKGGYYDQNGKNKRKAFLRSPMEFSRITSGFTRARFHPVLKRWRAHKGVDYGAPIGTRVRATSDGVVEFAGWQGGYGRLVVLRHANNFSTAYGHLNGFAKGIRRGARVEQGAVIGFVGKTGLASGPHLHYEFRVGGKHVNPLRVALPEAKPLTAAAVPKFKELMGEQGRLLASAEPSTVALVALFE